jgi:predicted dehydrogenase
MNGNDRPLRIGLFGAGRLGRIHLRCLKEAEGIELVGFYEPDPDNADRAASELIAPRFSDIGALLDKVDAVDIVATTSAHYGLAAEAIRLGKHVFVEKPLAATVAEARELTALVEHHGLVGQVGHVERFNPALLALGDMPLKPLFVETHRLSPFTGRGADVSVVADLMIHDLDMLLYLIPSPIVSIQASGVPILSATPDIANARIEFANGCTANLTASRVSLKQMRKTRLFQPDAYISLDFLEKSAEVVQLFDSPDSVPPGADVMAMDLGDRTRYLLAYSPPAPPINAIRMELEAFARSIRSGSRSPVPFSEGLRALELAEQVDELIRRRIDQTLLSV